jgi:hypothetical protein
VSGECGGRDGSGVRGKGGKEENRRKGQKNSWGRERKLGQERTKQIDFWTERKREISHNGL